MYQLILVVIICFVYSYSWEFRIFDVWDDQVYILYNKHLYFSLSNILYWFTHKCVGIYLPLTMITYIFDYSIWGLNSFGYHLQNIFWHIVTVLAVYNCFRLFKIKCWIALFLCIIFAVHPQRVESVVWLSERKDVLCAAFYFLSLYFYIKNRYAKFSIFAFLFFILSMLSKPMAVSLPIILLIYEFYRWGKGRLQTEVRRLKTDDCRLETNERSSSVARNPLSVTRSQWIKDKSQKTKGSLFVTLKFKSLRVLRGEKFRAPIPDVRETITHHSSFNIQHYLKLWPYFLVLVIFIPITILTQSDFDFISVPVTVLEKLYSVLFNLFWYTKETLFPTELNPLYPTTKLYYSVIEVTVFYFGCIILAILVIVKNKNIYIYKALPLFLCYIVSLSPVIGIIRLGAIDHADRYSYIPSVFIWLGVGIVLNKILYQKDTIKIKRISLFQTSFLFSKKFIIIILIAYTTVLVINNFRYQWYWENKLRLFNYSVQSTPSSYLALNYLIDMEYNRKNYHNAIILADRLDTEYGLYFFSEYYRSLVIYKFNRKLGIKSFIQIEPKLKTGIQFEFIHSKYVKLLGSIVSWYESQGNIPKSLVYINKMLELTKLSDFIRFTCLGLKSFYLKNYLKSIYWYKKALEIKPHDKYLLNKLKLSTNKLYK